MNVSNKKNIILIMSVLICLCFNNQMLAMLRDHNLGSVYLTIINDTKEDIFCRASTPFCLKPISFGVVIHSRTTKQFPFPLNNKFRHFLREGKFLYSNFFREIWSIEFSTSKNSLSFLYFVKPLEKIVRGWDVFERVITRFCLGGYLAYELEIETSYDYADQYNVTVAFENDMNIENTTIKAGAFKVPVVRNEIYVPSPETGLRRRKGKGTSLEMIECDIPLVVLQHDVDDKLKLG